MSKRVYIDMDGTLCRFHDVEHKYIEQMWERGFYINLKPFEEFLQAISLCIDRNPDTEFFILSAILETEPPFAEAEKREWLHTYLPQLADDHMLFVPAGTDKAALIPNMDADCILIDDYNKNLSEWRQRGGTAIKFINDINDRGLGAYGGEKGNLWDGLRIRHDESAMAICLQTEHYAGIAPAQENATAFYGFEGDVQPETFLSLLSPYFSARQASDEQLVSELYRSGEIFADYGAVSTESHTLAAAFYADTAGKLSADFHTKYHADQAVMACLETCYTISKAHGISLAKMTGWLTASIKQDNAWKTYPVTPSNLQAYMTRMLARDARLKSLFAQIGALSVELKQTERRLYLPSPNEVAKDVISNHTQTAVWTEERQSLLDRTEVLKAEWQQLAGAEYPQLQFGRGQTPYSKYAPPQREQRAVNQKQ